MKLLLTLLTFASFIQFAHSQESVDLQISGIADQAQAQILKET